MEIIDVDITEIKPYKGNPRKISDDAVDKVAESIKEFGMRQPLVVDKDKTIVVGHTRYLACKKLRKKTIPCLIASDLSDAELKKYRIADNRVGEFSDWDFEKLKDEIEAIGGGMEALGLDDEFFKMEQTADIGNADKPVKVNTKPYTKVHILLSFDVSLWEEIQDKIIPFQSMKGVDYEQSAN
jgi:hypothetical protein